MILRGIPITTTTCISIALLVMTGTGCDQSAETDSAVETEVIEDMEYEDVVSSESAGSADSEGASNENLADSEDTETNENLADSEEGVKDVTEATIDDSLMEPDVSDERIDTIDAEEVDTIQDSQQEEDDEDTETTTSEDGQVENDAEEVEEAPVTWSQLESALKADCAPCHFGGYAALFTASFVEFKWDKLIKEINIGEMPPVGEASPSLIPMIENWAENGFLGD